MNLQPINQTKLYGLSTYLDDLFNLYKNNILPNKILLSGPKAIGKSTLAYHFINSVLSETEEYKYDIKNNIIDERNKSFKLINNKSHPNMILIDINEDKKYIDIDQIRNLISNLNKTSFNSKIKFILIDNIEFLNISSINALLKILEEPNVNCYFILIKNDKSILKTLTSRCLNFKINLTSNESLLISEKLIGKDAIDTINKDLINYYISPGNFYRLLQFSKINDLNLSNLDLKEFLNILIKENYYKKDFFIKKIIYDFIEFYFRKKSKIYSKDLWVKYSSFLKKISDTKKFNLDEEILLMEFESEILNG